MADTDTVERLREILKLVDQLSRDISIGGERCAFRSAMTSNRHSLDRAVHDGVALQGRCRSLTGGTDVVLSGILGATMTLTTAIGDDSDPEP